MGKHFSILFLFCWFAFSFGQRGKDRLLEIEKFIQKEKYNSDLAIFIDFRIPSNKNRFFLYSFKRQRILEKGLVAHGAGSEKAHSSTLIFSNTENSYQSSLGKYEIGKSYSGAFGKSYRLKGLDATNNKAMKRAIVLHPYGCVPDEETSKPICLSLGCPMVSQNFFNTVARYIDASNKIIIMYAYY